MTEFTKTVLGLCTKIAGKFLENRTDTIHKYELVALRAQSASCTV